MRQDIKFIILNSGENQVGYFIWRQCRIKELASRFFNRLLFRLLLSA